MTYFFYGVPVVDLMLLSSESRDSVDIRASIMKVNMMISRVNKLCSLEKKSCKNIQTKRVDYTAAFTHSDRRPSSLFDNKKHVRVRTAYCDLNQSCLDVLLRGYAKFN